MMRVCIADEPTGLAAYMTEVNGDEACIVSWAPGTGSKSLVARKAAERLRLAADKFDKLADKHAHPGRGRPVAKKPAKKTKKK